MAEQEGRVSSSACIMFGYVYVVDSLPITKFAHILVSRASCVIEKVILVNFCVSSRAAASGKTCRVFRYFYEYSYVFDDLIV